MGNSFLEPGADEQAHRLGIALILGGIATVLAIGVAITHPDLVNLEFSLSAFQMLVAAGSIVAAVLIVRSPAVAVVSLVTFIYLNLSEVLVREYELPSVLQLLVIPIAVAVLLHDAPTFGRVIRQPATLLILGYTVVLFLTTTFAESRAFADDRARENLKAVILYLLVATLAASATRFRWSILAVIAAGAFLSALAVIQAATGDFSNEFLGFARIKYAQIYGEVFQPRLSGPLGDPNFFAQILLIPVPLALALTFEEKSRRLKAVFLALTALIVAGVLLTYSRGGALALVAVIALSFLARGLSRREIIGAAIVLVIGLAFLPTGFVERLTTIEQIIPGGESADLHPDSSFAKRKLLTAAAWEMFLDRPFLGVGGGNYTLAFEEYADRVGSVSRDYDDPDERHYPHNLYLEVAAESGLLGLLVFAGIVMFVLQDLRQSRRFFLAAGDHRSAMLATAVGIALLGYLISSLFLHGHFERYLWLTFAFAIALRVRSEQIPPRPHEVPTLRLVESPPRLDRTSAGARRPVAIFLSRFPLITETFILRELIELERQGQPVVLVPMLREESQVVHEEAKPWVKRALYTPYVDATIAAANLRQFLDRPLRYIRVLLQLIAGTLSSPNMLIRSLAVFPKSVYLAERLRSEGVRHIHAHFATHPATMAWIVSSFSGITYSMTVHAHDIFVRRQLLRRKLRNAAFVRAISRFNAQFLAVRYPDECAGKLRVIRVGVQPDLYRTFSPPFETDEPPLIVCVAALKPYKGLRVLIEACAQVANKASFRCRIVGEGPLRGELQDAIHKHGLSEQVHLAGVLPQHQVADLLRRADLVVLPSVVAPDGQMEGIPVSLMEAMAAGRPVIASRISGIPELIDDSVNGILVPPENSVELAAAILKLFDDPDRAARMGERAREKVNADHTLRRSVHALVQQLDEHNPPVAVEALDYFRHDRLGIRRVYRSRDSEVMRLMAAWGDNGTRDFIIKRPLSRAGESRPPFERARHEFEVLRSLSRKFASSSTSVYGVPEVLHFAENSGSIVLEPCQGAPLDSLIRQGRLTTEVRPRLALLDAMRRTGAWLRLFQYFTRTEEPAVLGVRSLSDRIAADLTRIEENGFAFGKAPRLRSRFEALGESARFTAATLVGHHGDFWPGNVFASPDRLQVIDFEGYREAHPLEDVAWFLLHLELFYAWPGLRSEYGELEDAFFLGYLDPPRSVRAIVGPGTPMLGAAFELCRGAAALHLLAREKPQTLRHRRVLLRHLEVGA